MPRLEHANICVHDVDGVIRFLQTAFPQFRIRYDAINEKGMRWVHIGTDDNYVALNAANPDEPKLGTPYAGRPGLNHLAYVVDDVDSIRNRLAAAGYQESTPANKHPFRSRIYFYDPEGNDWEFVQYRSDESHERHDYELPDG